MLKNWNKPERPKEEELEERLQAARAKLSVQQMQIKEHKLPVFVSLRGGELPEKAVFWERLSRKSIPGFSKLPPWISQRKRKNASRFCTVIS